MDMEFTQSTNPTEEVTMSQSITFTHASYAEAQKALKANKRTGNTAIVTWDAGDGWKGVGYYCSRRNRLIQAIEKNGFRLV